VAISKLPWCYYAFPEFRYPEFEPNKRFEKKVAQALENDEDLGEEVEIIRKEIQLNSNHRRRRLKTT
jgi:hypothetical protein